MARYQTQTEVFFLCSEDLVGKIAIVHFESTKLLSFLSCQVLLFHMY